MEEGRAESARNPFGDLSRTYGKSASTKGTPGAIEIGEREGFDAIVERMTAFTQVHYEEAIESEIRECDAHRFGDLRSVRVLHLEPDPAATAYEQQVELGTRVRPVKVGVAISVETANDLLDGKTLPRPARSGSCPSLPPRWPDRH